MRKRKTGTCQSYLILVRFWYSSRVENMAMLAAMDLRPLDEFELDG